MKVLESKFGDAFQYKVIYIFEISDEKHKGLLKIGDATIDTNKPIDQLNPNCKDLNQAALSRIKQYTNTVGVTVKLLHTELAVRSILKDGDFQLKAFRDYDVHRVLLNSRIQKIKLANSTSREWFKVDLETAIKAIEAVKQSKPNLGNESSDNFIPIVFRPEQEEAIEKTLSKFKTQNRMLWNAKMRFGKTLSALEVVKKSKFKKTIILTHRPVVDAGWYEDFSKIFHNMPEYEYGSKSNGATLSYLKSNADAFVYFASIQDLRGSKAVGGRYDKNNDVFDLNWDLVIVDEAHEGTTTALGDEVIKRIVKEDNGKTKFLALSGTPFNILRNFDENIYTWDYIKEQASKAKWDKEHFGDSNPYDELPELKIYTYDLGKLIENRAYVELDDKAFNFHEFFRTWTGDARVDHRVMPEGTKIGDFVHEDDIKSFLNLITKEDSDSCYPFANEEYRQLFKHSLWMVPGVREAKALSKLMRKHPVFGSGAFEIVNVAGDGDEEVARENALELVRKAINDASDDSYTITLSCGKLTAGVTVPEWTAVFYLSGSFSTSASNYLQTIFRVQSPCNKNGKIKTCCYVFDFAPDRTLKMVAESVALSTKAGKTTESDKRIMGEFLNYCPVISIEGTVMKQYNTNALLQQLKRAYAERAVRNGFDDTNLYNDELLKIDGIDLEKFKELEKIIGRSKPLPKPSEVDINNQGFTDEEYDETERIRRKPPKERTPEEKEKLRELQEKKKQRKNAISILRGISIRMPLLIYGADIDINEDITMGKLIELVDDESWKEFMPSGVTKEIFQRFIKYYDEEIFIAAGRNIRNTAKAADELTPTERVKEITSLFAYFKNPDKETVLTPWRVVNMHMSDTLGGYDFYDKEHDVLIETPRYVDRGKVTLDTLSNIDSQILELNSKTGLYPLYVTYSVFKARCDKLKEEELTFEKQWELWAETVKNNIFVICKTPMAKFITKRTLVGYHDKAKVNAHYFDDLVNMMENKPENFENKVTKSSYWKKEGSKMKFDAVVGNPPYMIMDGGAQASAKPIYHHFIQAAKKIKPEYASFVIPTRWYAGGKGLDEFRDEMINDEHLEVLHDFLAPEKVFPNTNIRGGICYFLWDKKYDNKSDLVRVVTHDANGVISDVKRKFKTEGSDIFIRHYQALSILDKVREKTTTTMDEYISGRKPFGIDGNIITTDDFHSSKTGLSNPVLCYGKAKSIGYLEENQIKNKKEWIPCWKVYMPYANNIGTELNDDNQNTFIGEPNSVCTETFLVVGADMNLDKKKAKNLSEYLKTKFARFMLSLAKASQHATSKTYKFVPAVDISVSWTDAQLYKEFGLSPEDIIFIENSIKSM